MVIKDKIYIIKSKMYGEKEVLLDKDIYSYLISNKITLTLHCAKRYNIPYVKFNIYKEGKRTTILLHRFITNCPEGMVVDHINHNPLDNRRSNLKVCRVFDNANNRTRLTIGVNKHCSGKWRAYIAVNKKQISLGYYNNYEDAVEKRLQAELEYYGGRT